MFLITPKCQPGLDVERKEDLMATPKASLELYGRCWSLHNQKFLKQVKETSPGQVELLLEEMGPTFLRSLPILSPRDW